MFALVARFCGAPPLLGQPSAGAEWSGFTSLHCEERSDVAIHGQRKGLGFARLSPSTSLGRNGV